MEQNRWYKMLKGIGHAIIKERNGKTVEREDVLLQHIEEFKQKARELQDLMGNKEERVKELQGEVEEKEEELHQRELAVSKMEEDFEVRKETVTQLSAGVQEQIEAMMEKLDALSTRIEEQAPVDVVNGIGENGERIIDLQNSIVEVRENLQQAREELGDKVHTENVKGYRNMKSLITTLENNLLSKEEETSRYSSLKNLLTCTTFVSIGIFIVVVMLLLSECGVI